MMPRFPITFSDAPGIPNSAQAQHPAIADTPVLTTTEIDAKAGALQARQQTAQQLIQAGGQVAQMGSLFKDTNNVSKGKTLASKAGEALKTALIPASDQDDPNTFIDAQVKAVYGSFRQEAAKLGPRGQEQFDQDFAATSFVVVPAVRNQAYKAGQQRVLGAVQVAQQTAVRRYAEAITPTEQADVRDSFASFLVTQQPVLGTPATEQLLTQFDEQARLAVPTIDAQRVPLPVFMERLDSGFYDVSPEEGTKLLAVAAQHANTAYDQGVRAQQATDKALRHMQDQNAVQLSSDITRAVINNDLSALPRIFNEIVQGGKDESLHPTAVNAMSGLIRATLTQDRTAPQEDNRRAVAELLQQKADNILDPQVVVDFFRTGYLTKGTAWQAMGDALSMQDNNRYYKLEEFKNYDRNLGGFVLRQIPFLTQAFISKFPAAGNVLKGLTDEVRIDFHNRVQRYAAEVSNDPVKINDAIPALFHSTIKAFQPRLQNNVLLPYPDVENADAAILEWTSGRKDFNWLAEQIARQMSNNLITPADINDPVLRERFTQYYEMQRPKGGFTTLDLQSTTK